MCMDTPVASTKDMTTGRGHPRVEFRLEGETADDGLVRAHDFVAFMESFVAVLRKLQDNRESSEIVYRIAALSIGSAAGALEVQSIADEDAEAESIVGRFLEGSTALASGVFPEGRFEPDVERAFVALAAPLRKHVRTISFRADSDTVTIRRSSFDRVALTPVTTSEAMGSMDGRVDAVNVHKEPIFYLYPVSGPNRILCQLDRAMMEDLRAALRRQVRVHGLCEFTADDPFPRRIIVERVEIKPPDEELPTLRSLLGSIPDI